MVTVTLVVFSLKHDVKTFYVTLYKLILIKFEELLQKWFISPWFPQ